MLVEYVEFKIGYWPGCRTLLRRVRFLRSWFDCLTTLRSTLGVQSRYSSAFLFKEVVCEAPCNHFKRNLWSFLLENFEIGSDSFVSTS